MRFRFFALLALCYVPLAAARALRPQQGAQQVASQERFAFADGETARYRASWGILGRAGNATITVNRDTLRGDTVLHAALAVQGGIPGARFTEMLDTWMDARTLASRRFTQHTRYPSFARDRLRDLDAANLRWTGHTNARADSGTLPTNRPLDDLSAVFVARTVPLIVGQDVVLNDYWRPESNPITLRVLRTETIKVPAGTYQTIVVRPIIRTSSLFAEDGEAEVYLSEGAKRELVMLKAKLKLGTLVLRLERYEQTPR